MEQPRFHSPALAHLEAHYEARPNEKFHGEASVTISTAANLRAEVEGLLVKFVNLSRMNSIVTEILQSFFVTEKVITM